jgi:hypothetical protein
MKETQPPINSKKQEALIVFQNTVVGLKKEEEMSDGAMHLVGCDPTELTEEDQDLYEKFRSGYFSYQKIFEKYAEQRKSKNKSQKLFLEYIANLLARKFSVSLLKKR